MGLGSAWGLLGFARLLMAVETTAPNQFVRIRLWPKCSLLELLLPVLFVSLSVAAHLILMGGFRHPGYVESSSDDIHLRGCGSAVVAILRTFPHSDTIRDRQKEIQ